MTATGPAATTPRGPVKAQVLALAAIVIASLALTLPITLIGAVTAGMHLTGGETTWYHGLFEIASAASGLPWAALGDRGGRKPVLVAGFALVTAGSALALAAPSIGVLMAAQVVSGLGGGALYTCSLAVLIAASSSAASRGTAIALWSAGYATGTAGGQLLAGAAARGSDWRPGYVPLLAVAAVACVASAWVAPSLQPVARRRRYDWLGQALVVVLISAVSYGLIEGPVTGWGSAEPVAGFAIAAAALVAFLYAESRHAEPLLHLRLFRVPAFSVAAIAALACYAAFVATAYLMSLVWGVADGLDPWQIGARGAVWSVPTLVLYPLLRRALARVSGRWMLSAGLLPLAAGQAWFARLPAGAGFWLTCLPGLLAGIGFAFFTACITVAAVNSVPPSSGGVASGTTETLRVLGTTVGSAIAGAIAFSRASNLLVSGLRASSLSRPAVGAALAANRHGGVLAAAAAGHGSQVTVQAIGSLSHGLSYALDASAILTLATAVVIALALRDRPGQLATEEELDLHRRVSVAAAATAQDA